MPCFNKVCSKRATNYPTSQSNLVIGAIPVVAVGRHCVMPELHGVQLKEVVAMSSPVVLITGALTGIGRATALTFTSEGARVVISGRREEEGKKLLAELRKLGAEAEFVRSDVRREEDMRSLVDKTVERFGRRFWSKKVAALAPQHGPD